MRPLIGRHRAEQRKRRFAGVCAVAVLVGAALASHAVWAQQPRPAQPQRTPQAPITIGPRDSVDEICRDDLAKLTCDIASNPQRLRLASGLGSMLSVQDAKTINPNAGVAYRAFDRAVAEMRESARRGWVADTLIGDLAAIGIPRHAKERNPDGTYTDYILPLSTRLMEGATSTPPALNDRGAPRVLINNTRACVNSFQNVMMDLAKWLGTEGQPATVTNQALRDLIENDRRAKSDADLERDVRRHLETPGRSTDYTSLLQDCGFLGLRQLHDEGFRYTGPFMTTPPRR